MDEIYRMASDVMIAIATLGVREAVAAAEPAGRWPRTGRVAFLLTCAGTIIAAEVIVTCAP